MVRSGDRYIFWARVQKHYLPEEKKKVVEACFINSLLLFLDYTPVEAHIWNDTSDMLYTR